MANILNNKKFINAENTANGEVSGETVFNYKQDGKQIEAVYSGGAIKKGHLIGVMTGDNTFTMFYHHVNLNDDIRAGQCHSTILTEQNGKLKLIESWQWLNGDCSKGQSVLIERA